MRTLSGTESAKVLVEESGAEAQYALLTADLDPGAAASRVRRSVVFVPGNEARAAFLVAVELVKPLPETVATPCWVIDGASPTEGGFVGRTARGAVFFPSHGHVKTATASAAGAAQARLCWDDASSDPRLVAAVQFLEHGREASAIEPIAEIDLIGARLADWVVLFHNGMTTGRSAVSFEVRGEGKLHYLLTGLGAGGWEIWRNGFVTHPQTYIPRRSAALYFEGLAGDYFLRPLN